MCSSLGLKSEDNAGAEVVLVDEERRHRLKGKRRAACMGRDENIIIMVVQCGD
jgi:hypothetical protein